MCTAVHHPIAGFVGILLWDLLDNLPLICADVRSPSDDVTRYYDIFVTHAFGNYKDIMREVAASPFMGEYLSMRGNVAFSSLNKHPDENFAREIMQVRP